MPGFRSDIVKIIHVQCEKETQHHQRQPSKTKEPKKDQRCAPSVPKQPKQVLMSKRKKHPIDWGSQHLQCHVEQQYGKGIGQDITLSRLILYIQIKLCNKIKPMLLLTSYLRLQHKVLKRLMINKHNCMMTEQIKSPLA